MTANRPDYAMELANVSFAYRREAILRGVDVHIHDGEMVGIVGPNGSGKSTMLRIMAGLMSADSGQVKLFENPIETYNRREVARYIAYVAQETPVSFGYTAGDFVMMGRRPYQGFLPFETHQDEEAARRAMRDTDTEQFVDRSILELSGGERQRVVVAAALAQEPSIMLLDEPTAALDLRYQMQIHMILHRMNVERQITVVVITHDLNLAALFFTRVLVLSEGRVIADGPPKDVLTPELIREVYHVDVTTGAHPDGTPIYVPNPPDGIRS
ncbi:MAG: ABC transporter ATP-binding protein [Deltaproteobacteria bacterium]|nr:ABC transporter ATP-binding protein [Deltaproteobacteria bacterium]MCB9479856.1 ABC transporter ATP-binding protein [Deltaproteobacteria bacterium]